MSVSAGRCMPRNGCRPRAGGGAVSRQASRTFWLLAAGPLLAAGLAACSGTADDLLNPILPEQDAAYKSSKTAPPLEVPPDLSSETLNDTMVVPSLAQGTATYSAYANGTQMVSAGVNGVLPRLDGVRVERAGSERWLIVDVPPGVVWPKVRNFWLSQGFLIQMEDPGIGIMETDWAEKKTKFEAGAISGFFSKLSSQLYGSTTRDMYRTRLEHGTIPGTTEVYVSHRGAEYVSTGKVSRSLDATGNEEVYVWQPRPSDPELEAEMLNRLVITFGINKEAATSLVANAAERPPRAHIVRDGEGASVLDLQDNFSRAWRRTGLALDRVGFTVQDRDRSRGLYYVRYIDTDRLDSGKDDSFFGSLKFWGDDEPSDQNEYLVSLVGKQSTTQIVILDTDGKRENGETANRILGLLHEQLK
ncbi:MAG: outer membrane protein assembly factor BamC [Gammaproteobacteria bacterium]|nr:MAG: outer membrane protein assembly factor BamC [Gammaproteobacteria bacterium]